MSSFSVKFGEISNDSVSQEAWRRDLSDGGDCIFWASVWDIKSFLGVKTLDRLLVAARGGLQLKVSLAGMVHPFADIRRQKGRPEGLSVCPLRPQVHT
jgi:hypothetical protein